MSSILNALKKIEQMRHAEESAGNHAAESAPSTFLPPRSSLTTRIRKAFPYVLAAVLASFAGIGAYFWWTSDRPPLQTAGQPNAFRAAIPPVPESQAPVAPPPPPARPPAGTEIAPAAPPPRPAARVQAPPPSARLRPRDDTKALTAGARPPIAKRDPLPEGRPGANRPSPSRSAEDALSRLDDSKLKVMAIAWSDDPQRRLAVLNGHIVKEGESVEGYSVTQIRKDDVIVNDGSQSWRVELNLKTQP